MEFFEVIQKRRSIRKFLPDEVPSEVMEKAIDAALLAPNSSNMQTWDFFWIKSKEIQKEIVPICLGQSAARDAKEFLVVTADPKKWKRARGPMLDFVKRINAPKLVITYYDKLIPLTYRSGPFSIFAPLKFLMTFFAGLFRPVPRGPDSFRDLQEIALKSASLAAENFVLAITAQGFSTCMMEGFDKVRMRKLLKLPCSTRIVMVIAVGKESPRGTWGPQFRLPKEEVVHIL